MSSRNVRLVTVLMLLTIFVSTSTGGETAISPTHSIKLLKEGSARYMSGDLTYPRQSIEQVKATASRQHPLATVLSCSDSRVPVEQVFDLGIGDLFVVRVAGNVAGVNELASIEFGVGHLGTPTLVVLGHTDCGAVTAAVNHAEISGSQTPLMEKIAPAVERAAQENPSKSGVDLIPSATVTNVWMTIESILSQSQLVRQRVIEGKLTVVGGVYHLSDGHIDWMGSHAQQASILAKALSDIKAGKDEEFYATIPCTSAASASAGNSDTRSSAEALTSLKEGNTRFVSARRTYPDQDLQRMQDVATKGQHPYAVVLTCSDSRVPVENLMDAGLGDIFVVRVAGNVAGVLETGSIEYALEQFKTPLLIVMGHSSCGVVTAAASKIELEGSLTELVDRIQPAVALATDAHPTGTEQEIIDKAIDANIWQTISDLYRQSPKLCRLVKEGRLSIQGAKYNLSDGSVDWLGNHPAQVSLVEHTLENCVTDGQQRVEAADAFPAVEPVTEQAAIVPVVEQPVEKPGNTLRAALDRLQQQVDALQQAQQPQPTTQVMQSKSASARPVKPVETESSDAPVSTLRQQILQLQAELRKLTDLVIQSRLADSTIACIISDIEFLKSENSALKGVAEQTSQKLASIDDDVIPSATLEEDELARFAGLVDQLNSVVEKAKTPAKPTINSPEVKRGSITMTGLLNQQYYERGGDNKLSTFDNKRARLGFNGVVNSYAKIGLQGEFAKSVKLLDGFVTLTPNKEWSLKFGQFQPAFGQNFLRAPAAYTLISTSLAMPLGTDRDIGTQLAWEHAFSKQFSLQLTTGLFNGSGINVADSNAIKNSVVRAQIKVGSTLTVGANNYAGKSNNALNPKNVDSWGSFANWTWNNEEVEAEYIQTKVGGLEKDGWYVWGGHLFKTSWKFVPEIQMVGRYEEYDVNRAKANDKVNRVTLGTTFYIDKKFTLIQLNYQFNGEEGARIRNNEFLVNFQVGF